MSDLSELILAELSHANYKPLKPKALARKMGLPVDDYPLFKAALKELIAKGRAEIGRSNVVRALASKGDVIGVFRKTSGGFGFVRPADATKFAEVYIPEGSTGDASTGDVVLVRIRRKSSKPGVSPTGEIVQVMERVTRQFVGTYFERDGEGHVRIDGTVFSHSISVGDPGAKGHRRCA